MNDWLKISKEQFQEHIFDFLWQQWSTLGVAGVVQSTDDRIIDPEALLLFSLSICRYEPRLFDEIIDWLFQNGQFINVQRLSQLQMKHQFHCGGQLSAIAEMLCKNSTYKQKWSKLANTYCQDPVEPLFSDKDGNVLPCPKDNEAQREFLRHGIRRGKINLRGYSQSFDTQSPSCLLLQLRALIGINARAEIFCLLASTKEIHPSEAARKTGYNQKTIQTSLIEMARSGVILIKQTNKEKFYRLKPGVLDTLLRPNNELARWTNWPELLKVIETIWLKISDPSLTSLEPLLLTTELKKLLRSIYEDCITTEIDEIVIDSHIHIEAFPEAFREKLQTISDYLAQIPITSGLS